MHLDYLVNQSLLLVWLQEIIRRFGQFDASGQGLAADTEFTRSFGNIWLFCDKTALKDLAMRDSSKSLDLGTFGG